MLYIKLENKSEGVNILKKVTLDDIKNHFSYCIDEGLTIGEYEEALLNRLYRTINTHERKYTEYTETLNETRRKRDEVKNKLAIALKEIKELKQENERLKKFTQKPTEEDMFDSMG